MQEEKQSLGEKLSEVYRFSVTDLDTLKEVKTFDISIRNFLTLLFFSLLLIILLYTAFIAYTPARRLIPGYGNIEENSQFLELREKLVALEEQVESQRIYNDGLRRMLQGDKLEESEKQKVVNTVLKTDSSNPEVISNSSIKETSFASKLDNLYFVAPIYGIVSAKYDLSIDHYGTDIVAKKDTPIKAIARGVVISSDWTAESGNTIVIQHPNDIVSVYKHNSSLLKKTGEYVNAGEAIAVIGNTGKLTDGPHLHFELWYDGLPVNPENYLSFR